MALVAGTPDRLRRAATLEPAHTGKHRLGAERVAEAGDPVRIGIVLFSTLQGIATIVNGGIVEPELLDGLVETAVHRFPRGSAPTAGPVSGAGGR